MAVETQANEPGFVLAPREHRFAPQRGDLSMTSQVLPTAVVKRGVSDEFFGRFGHHPEPDIDFCIEVEALEARCFDARHRISKPGTDAEKLEDVVRDISLALRFEPADRIAQKAKTALLHLIETATGRSVFGQRMCKCGWANHDVRSKCRNCGSTLFFSEIAQ